MKLSLAFWALFVAPCSAFEKAVKKNIQGGRRLATSGDPDANGMFFCSDSDTALGYEWVEISGTGTTLLLGEVDDRISPLTDIGFTFDFYGTEQTKFAASSNGGIIFGVNLSGNALPWSNQCLPSSLSFPYIALFQDDVCIQPGGAIYYQNFDVCPIGSALGACLVVQFQGMEYWSCGNFGNVVYQGVLFETGDIYLQYKEVNMADFSGASNGASATIGIQGNSAKFLQYSCDTASLSNGLAIGFQKAFRGNGVCGYSCSSAPPQSCGNSVFTGIVGLECCDEATNAVGLACCDKTPYNPKSQVCCDGFVVYPGCNPNTDCPAVCNMIPYFPNTQVCCGGIAVYPGTNPVTDCPGGCAGDMNACEYKLDENGNLVPSKIVICYSKVGKKNVLQYINECVDVDTITNFDYWKDEDQPITNCGCCTAGENTLPLDARIKNPDEKYCSYPDCFDPTDDYIVDSKGKLKEVAYCAVNEFGIEETVWEGLFWDGKDYEEPQCGSCTE